MKYNQLHYSPCTTRHHIALIVFLAFTLLSSCGSQRESLHTSTVSLLPDKSQAWQLTILNGREVPQNAKPVTLTFNPEAKSFRGETACNFYAGTYTIGEASTSDGRRPFSIEYSGSGSILCPDADMNAEGRFLATFHKANYILITEYTLSFYRDNKEILRFGIQ